MFTEDIKARAGAKGGREGRARRAGAKGDLTIPETFKIAVQPLEGADAHSMTARLKYRLGGGSLTLGYKLEQPEERAKAAFADVLTAIGEGIGTPVPNGTPA